VVGGVEVLGGIGNDQAIAAFQIVKEINTTAKPEKRDKNISEAVAKIFKNYPPKAS